MKPLRSCESMSLSEALDYLPQAHEQIISIGSPEDSPRFFTKRWLRSLQLDFEDFTLAALEANPEWRQNQFTQEQALRLLTWYVNTPETITHTVVHCHAGISRSPAVCVFLEQFFGVDYMRSRSTVYPNDHVVAVLRKVAGD